MVEVFCVVTQLRSCHQSDLATQTLELHVRKDKLHAAIAQTLLEEEEQIFNST